MVNMPQEKKKETPKKKKKPIRPIPPRRDQFPSGEVGDKLFSEVTKMYKKARDKWEKSVGFGEAQKEMENKLIDKDKGLEIIECFLNKIHVRPLQIAKNTLY